jgi:hypothetical protein
MILAEQMILNHGSQNTPEKAINNADSFEYVLEDNTP